MIVLNPGGLEVVSLRLEQRYRGVWSAELELAPDVAALAPSSGPVTITIGAAPAPVAVLQATVDPRGTGAFVSLYALRVLGGAGGWDKPVTRQHFHADAGLTTLAVYQATAAQVAEKLVGAPAPITDFLRTAGPASRVLNLEPSWWVDPTTGVTTVGPRPPAVADPSFNLVFWDAATQVAEFTCDTVVAPGTVVVDPRIGPTPVVLRDVEQVFDREGSKGTAWCGTTAVTQVANDLRSLVEEFGGLAYLRTYLYRVAVQDEATGRLGLQAIHPTDGVPDAIPLTPWTGMPGGSAKFKPGTTVRVAFVAGDPSKPLVDAYDGTVPLEAILDATVLVSIGPGAPLVQLAGGAVPFAMAPYVEALVATLGTWASGFGGGGAPATQAQVFALAAALVSALSGIPPASTKVQGI